MCKRPAISTADLSPVLEGLERIGTVTAIERCRIRQGYWHVIFRPTVIEITAVIVREQLT